MVQHQRTDFSPLPSPPPPLPIFYPHFFQTCVSVRACVRASVRACVSACVHMCVSVCLSMKERGCNFGVCYLSDISYLSGEDFCGAYTLGLRGIPRNKKHVLCTFCRSQRGPALASLREVDIRCLKRDCSRCLKCDCI